MYSTKKNVLQLVALMKAHHIRHVVLCPGSRNAPLAETLANCPDFICYSVVDERSAAFFALGIAQLHLEPTAVCCTSGTALLNMAPAVAEAFYQEIPLLVISADRPQAWIGQKDGQTLPQPSAFEGYVKRSVQLPEPMDPVSSWYGNRLINEALLSLTHQGNGPVHINVPITEPFFDFSETTLPQERVIIRLQPEVSFPGLTDVWNSASRVMVVVGQMLPDEEVVVCIREMEELGCVVVNEHLSNYSSRLPDETGSSIHYDWNLLTATAKKFPSEEKEYPKPDLVLYCGGHFVSKNIKAYLRSLAGSTTFVQLHPNGELTDTFMSTTYVIEAAPQYALRGILATARKKDSSFRRAWTESGRKINRMIQDLQPTHSSIYRIKQLIESLPGDCALHLANSSTIRLAELARVPSGISVYCNRGTSGIEGSLSTAAGYAAGYAGYTYMVIGDLSYFYDLNIVRHSALFSRLRIILLHNGGGEIFHTLPGMSCASQMEPFIAASHSGQTKGWLSDCGIRYYYADQKNSETEETIRLFLKDREPGSALLELRFDAESDRMAYEDFYGRFRQKAN